MYILVYLTLLTLQNILINFVVVLLVLHATLNSLGLDIGAHGTDVSVGIHLLSGETLLQAKNSTDCRWDSNPGP